METSQLILFFARVVVGVVMVYYGVPKIKNLRANAKDFVKMGFRPGWIWGTIMACLEFLGGIAMIVGYHASLVASLYAFAMFIGFVWKFKSRKPFSDYSYDLQLLALCLILASFGGGVWSVV
jgi:uncharacterized membrane protein YphA (DoxX/SURF4 family)